MTISPQLPAQARLLARDSCSCSTCLSDVTMDVGSGEGSEKKSTKCGLCETAESTVACQQCDATFCSGCGATLHEKGIFKSHNMVALKPGGGDEWRGKARVCNEHDGEKLTLYCQTDRCFVCAHCVLIGQHRGHECKSLKTAFFDGKSELQNKLAGLEAKQAELTELMGALSTVRQSVSDASEEMHSEIDSQVAAIAEVLHRREAELTTQVKRLEQTKLAQLVERGEDLENISKSLADCLSNMDEVLSKKDPYEFLDGAAAVEAAADASITVSLEATERTDVSFNLDLNITRQLKAIDTMTLKFPEPALRSLDGGGEGGYHLGSSASGSGNGGGGGGGQSGNQSGGSAAGQFGSGSVSGSAGLGTSKGSDKSHSRSSSKGQDKGTSNNSGAGIGGAPSTSAPLPPASPMRRWDPDMPKTRPSEPVPSAATDSMHSPGAGQNQRDVVGGGGGAAGGNFNQALTTPPRHSNGLSSSAGPSSNVCSGHGATPGGGGSSSLSAAASPLGPEWTGNGQPRDLTEAIQAGESGQFLKLSNQRLSEPELQSLNDLFRDHAALTTVDFTDSCIRNEGVTIVAQALALNNTVSAMGLSGNRIGDLGAQAVASMLQANKHLVSLYLRNNTIGPEGSTSLAQSLTVNKTLTKLNLKNNKLGAEGATALGEILGKNRTLAELNLWNNAIGAEGSKALAANLSGCALLELELGCNGIGDSGVAAIADSLPANRRLARLHLRWNNIGDAGAWALAEALRSNHTLSEVQLWGNSIQRDGEAAIARACGSNSRLKVVR